MPLNQTQLKYARERLEKEKAKKIAGINTATTIPAISFTLEEKIAKIKNNEFSIKLESHIHNWGDKIDFGEKPSYIITEERTRLTNELNIRYTEILDELVLGDSDEALKAIAEFSKYIPE